MEKERREGRNERGGGEGEVAGKVMMKEAFPLNKYLAYA